MNRIRTVPTQGGELHALPPGVDAWRTDTGYVIAPRGCAPFLISSDEEGALTPRAEAELARRGGISAAPSISADVELAKSIYGWATSEELVGIVSALGDVATDTIGLDLACGYGRLLLPLSERGLQLDGLDQSLAQVRDLRARVPRGTSRLFCAPLALFSAPQTYGFAIAASDAIRRLETRWALRTHLRNIANSLTPGGVYLVNTRLTSDPPEPYEVRRTVHVDGETLLVCREFRQYRHVTRQIVERLSVVRSPESRPIHEEDDLLVGLQITQLLDMVEATPMLALRQIYRSDFTPVDPSAVLSDEIWLALERTGS